MVTSYGINDKHQVSIVLRKRFGSWRMIVTDSLGIDRCCDRKILNLAKVLDIKSIKRGL